MKELPSCQEEILEVISKSCSNLDAQFFEPSYSTTIILSRNIT